MKLIIFDTCHAVFRKLLFKWKKATLIINYKEKKCLNYSVNWLTACYNVLTKKINNTKRVSNLSHFEREDRKIAWSDYVVMCLFSVLLFSSSRFDFKNQTSVTSTNFLNFAMLTFLPLHKSESRKYFHWIVWLCSCKSAQKFYPVNGYSSSYFADYFPKVTKQKVKINKYFCKIFKLFGSKLL